MFVVNLALTPPPQIPDHSESLKVSFVGIGVLQSHVRWEWTPNTMSNFHWKRWDMMSEKRETAKPDKQNLMKPGFFYYSCIGTDFLHQKSGETHREEFHQSFHFVLHIWLIQSCQNSFLF